MKYILPTIILVGLVVFWTIRDHEKKPAVTPDDLKEWIGFLASDDMKGRANGSPEMMEAADWIAGKFAEYGADQLPGTDSWFQQYTISSRRGEINERNVIAMLPGTDPDLNDQFIILSAHFDHIGIRKPVEGDSICNGADDNAAGTSTLIGIAKAFHDLKIKPGRTIILAAFSGEEMGMRGSRYFTNNSPIDLSKGYANLNFEMIGHSEYLGKGNYYMTGCSVSELDDVIKEMEAGTEFKLVDTIAMSERLFYMSDNAAFASIKTNDDISYGLPCGTFATTTFADYIHSPLDEAGLFDFENMAELVNHFAELVESLSFSSGSIGFTSSSFERFTGN